MRKKIFAVLMAVVVMTMTPITAKATTEISMGRCKITAYCPCESCSGQFGRQTSTGKTCRSGHTVAVDPDVIGYGTILLIGDTEYVAEDCGAHVKGDHIDIFFDTHEETEKFGVRYKNVWIVGRERDDR